MGKLRNNLLSRDNAYEKRCFSKSLDTSETLLISDIEDWCVIHICKLSCQLYKHEMLQCRMYLLLKWKESLKSPQWVEFKTHLAVDYSFLPIFSQRKFLSREFSLRPIQVLQDKNHPSNGSELQLGKLTCDNLVKKWIPMLPTIHSH